MHDKQKIYQYSTAMPALQQIFRQSIQLTDDEEKELKKHVGLHDNDKPMDTRTQ